MPRRACRRESGGDDACRDRAVGNLADGVCHATWHILTNCISWRILKLAQRLLLVQQSPDRATELKGIQDGSRQYLRHPCHRAAIAQPAHGDPPRTAVTYTRNGAFQVNANRQVVDTIGSTLQLLPIDASGAVTGTMLSDAFDFVLPSGAPGNPAASLVNISIGIDGLVTATYADGSDERLGKIAMASFTAQEGLRPVGDAHWQSTGESGPPAIDAATNGPLGTIRSGTLERANVDVTEELVALISAQRNFQANAKAIETASNMTQAIASIR